MREELLTRPISVRAGGIGGRPPRWAVLQRDLLDLLERATESYLQKYTRADGTLDYRGGPLGRDGADDFYESFYPLPYLYLLGGSDWLIASAHRHWEAATMQITELGLALDDFERGYDWFHQGEAQLLFYGLCLADPCAEGLGDRARRFADLYVRGPNYDRQRNMIVAPHTGSAGPRPGWSEEPVYPWTAEMARYGLPLDDVDGVHDYDDLRDPILAARMGEEMHRRARGDVAVNLATIALVGNAFALSGDRDLRDWVLRYAEGWLQRARDLGGPLPDNVGLSGVVGEDFDGRWFGGWYGWSWPHGVLSVGTAAAILAIVPRLLTGRDDDAEPLRAILDEIERRAKSGSLRRENGSLLEQFLPQLPDPDNDELLLVPHRRGRSGWFDFQPMPMALPTALWSASLAQRDWARIERWRLREGVDWHAVRPFRIKEDNGHERPWLAFLAGDNPDYPERMLEASIGVVQERLQAVEADDSDARFLDIHHWQEHNPATLEALFQLTLGAPPPLYNGGLLVGPVRHFDLERRRPGLPTDVAALVTEVRAERVKLELWNLSPSETREVAVQAGTFAEHSFIHARATDPAGDTDDIPVDDSWVGVSLPPQAGVRLQLTWQRYVSSPTALAPWERQTPRVTGSQSP